MERHFLGWDRPALHRAAEWLEDWRRESGDFRHDLVVLPTTRSMHRLQELMAEAARRNGWAYYPPRWLTVGSLPEELYEARRPFADQQTQTLAWVQVLQAFDARRLATLLGRLPGPQEWRRWWGLAELLDGVHRELASERLNTHRVLAELRDMQNTAEISRWEILAELERDYLSLLDEVGLWDRQTARLVALEQHEFHTECNIILVGLVDLNRTVRAMLDAITDSVTALVFAPPSLAGRFDEHGCLRPEAWHGISIDLPDAAWHIADDPLDAGQRVLEAIQHAVSVDRGRGPHDIVVGLPDARQLPVLQSLAAAAGLAIEHTVGPPLRRTELFQWFESVADWLATQRFTALARLVRHPWLEQWLVHHTNLEDNPPTLLDEYYATFLPYRIGRIWPQPDEPHSRSLVGRMKYLISALSGLLDGLDTTRPLSEWHGPIMDHLSRLGIATAGAADDESTMVGSGLEHLETIFSCWDRIPPRLLPEVEGPELLRWLVYSASSKRLSRALSKDAVEATGWLEIPWDDAEVAVVCGFNEGLIPQAVNADPFLPNQLRSRLGIDDNARRYARDAYATLLTLHSRRETVWISLRRSSDGDPLRPSRLLFQSGQEAESSDVREAKRILRFVREGGGERKDEVHLLRAGGTTVLDPPRPQPLAEPDRDRLRRLHVTWFRDYLASPYHFYLRRVLHLAELNDEQVEWDGAAFGTLTHQVLDAFGRSDVRDATESQPIREMLYAALDDRVAAFGIQASVPPVALQLEQLRQRLDVWAERQAEERRQGWEIRATEVACEWSFTEGGVDFTVRGRIDRIDWHPGLEIYRVLDYKTSDSGSPPQKTHRAKEEWIDLQLPLYRLMAAEHLELDGGASIELGYFLLPKRLESIGIAMAEWSDDDLADAERLARETALCIWNQQFDFDRERRKPAFVEDLAPITREDMLS